MAGQTPPIAQLPVQLTGFIGREREIDEVGRLLRTCRLVTLTGAGGSGKTRLALEVARQAARALSADDVFWVELSGVPDDDLVPEEVASALGVREEAAGSATSALLHVLLDRSALLILDNCEHVVAGVAELVDILLRRCPGVTVFATSREPLGVEGERAWLVPRLSHPEDGALSPGEAAQYEAVQLFVARAQDVLREFSLTDENSDAVVEVCQRLDGLPLAIELAAARVSVLSPAQISSRLDRAFELLGTRQRGALPRHRTLRATIDWSYRLLAPPEQHLLQTLSVFSGGFTLDAVEEIMPVAVEAPTGVLDLLSSLVDRSLVSTRDRAGHARYELLETVRQYAAEQWRSSDQGERAAERTAVHRRHAEHYLALAEAAHPALEGYRGFSEWLPRMRADQENIRSALAWSLEEAPGLALRLVGHLPYFWVPQPVHWREALRWTEAAIRCAPAAVRDEDRCKAAWAAGLLAVLSQEWSLARGYIDEAMELARALPDTRLRVLALGVSPMIAEAQGDLELAHTHAEEAVRTARELAEPWLIAVALITGSASSSRASGRPQDAEPALREALEVAQREGFAWCIWESAMSLSIISLERGQMHEATALVKTAASAAAQLGAEWHAARVVVVATAVVAANGEQALAGRLLGSVEAWLKSTGARLFPTEELLYQRLRKTLASASGERDSERATVEGAKLSVMAALGLAARLGEGYAESEAPREPVTAVESRRSNGAPHGSVPDLEVRSLGGVHIRLAGQEIAPEDWPYSKPRELLAYLLVHRRGRTRDQIAAEIWPDSAPSQVRNSFHVSLHHLRKVLGGRDWIVIEEDRYCLAPHRTCVLDADTFKAAARRLLAREDASPREIRDVLDLYGGPFLEGEATTPWVEEHAGRLGRLQIDLSLLLGSLLEKEGDFRGAAALYETLAGREALNEEVHRRLMSAWAHSGERVRALRHYDRLATLLEHELEAVPEPATRDVYDRIRGSTSSAS